MLPVNLFKNLTVSLSVAGGQAVIAIYIIAMVCGFIWVPDERLSAFLMIGIFFVIPCLAAVEFHRADHKKP